MNLTHFLIGDTVRNIVVDWSWNDKLSWGERREFHSLWSMSLSRSLLTTDLENLDSFEKSEVISTHVWSPGLSRLSSTYGFGKKRFSRWRQEWISVTFDRREFGDHCRGWVYKRQIHSIREREVNLTHLRSTKLIILIHCRPWTYKRQIHSRREKWTRLTFDRRDCRDNCRRMDLEKTNEFHSLSIDRIIQIIDVQRSRKVRYSFRERRKLDWISIDTDRVDGEINWVKLKVIYCGR